MAKRVATLFSLMFFCYDKVSNRCCKKKHFSHAEVTRAVSSSPFFIFPKLIFRQKDLSWTSHSKTSSDTYSPESRAIQCSHQQCVRLPGISDEAGRPWTQARSLKSTVVFGAFVWRKGWKMSHGYRLCHLHIEMMIFFSCVVNKMDY